MSFYQDGKIAALEELCDYIENGATDQDCFQLISDTFEAPLEKEASAEDADYRLGVESVCHEFLKEAAEIYATGDEDLVSIAALEKIAKRLSRWNTGEMARGAKGGALVGGVLGASGGLKGAVSGAAGGAVAGGLTNAVGQGLYRNTKSEVARSAKGGATLGATGGALIGAMGGGTIGYGHSGRKGGTAGAVGGALLGGALGGAAGGARSALDQYVGKKIEKKASDSSVLEALQILEHAEKEGYFDE